MAKDYGHTRRPARRQSTAPKLLGWVLVAFLSGYFTATVFDADSLSAWINNNLLPQAEDGLVATKPARHQKPPKPKFEFYTLLSKEAGTHAPATPASVVPKPTAAVVAAVPATSTVPATPATLSAAQTAALAQIAAAQSKALGQTPAPAASTPVAVNTPSQVKPLTPTSSSSKDGYLLQLASFRTRPDAEHMKASLTLKGFNVIITQVMQQQLTWFRVQVGPYATKDMAVKAQQEVARSERINGMIRKMDV